MLRLVDDGDLEFPRSVFVSPGDQVGGGYSFSSELVNDQAEYDTALKSGFFGSVPEAVEAFKNPKKPAAQVDEEPKKKPGRPPKDVPPPATVPEAVEEKPGEGPSE